MPEEPVETPEGEEADEMAKAMAEAMDQGGSEEPASGEEGTDDMAQAMADAMAEAGQTDGLEEEEDDVMAKAMAEAMADAGQGSEDAKPNAAAASPLSSLEPHAPEESMGKLDFILDVPLQITVNLGRTKMLIKELLQLGQGSVVELEKMAGEPMDVFIGERLIARGEVVVVNEKFGVRLTDIVNSVDRVKYLSN